MVPAGSSPTSHSVLPRSNPGPLPTGCRILRLSRQSSARPRGTRSRLPPSVSVCALEPGAELIAHPAVGGSRVGLPRLPFKGAAREARRSSTFPKGKSGIRGRASFVAVAVVGVEDFGKFVLEVVPAHGHDPVEDVPGGSRHDESGVASAWLCISASRRSAASNGRGFSVTPKARRPSSIRRPCSGVGFHAFTRSPPSESQFHVLFLTVKNPELHAGGSSIRDGTVSDESGSSQQNRHRRVTKCDAGYTVFCTEFAMATGADALTGPASKRVVFRRKHRAGGLHDSSRSSGLTGDVTRAARPGKVTMPKLANC